MTTIQKFNVILAIIVTSLLVLNFYPGKNPYHRLTTIALTDIDSIFISGVQQQMHLQKLQGRWIIDGKNDLSLNPERINQLLDLLQTHSFRQFENTLQNRQAFGLDKRTYQISFNELAITFGSTDPVEQLRYVMVNNEIHLINDQYYPFILADENIFIAQEKDR